MSVCLPMFLCAAIHLPRYLYSSAIFSRFQVMTYRKVVLVGSGFPRLFKMRWQKLVSWLLFFSRLDSSESWSYFPVLEISAVCSASERVTRNALRRMISNWSSNSLERHRTMQPLGVLWMMANPMNKSFKSSSMIFSCSFPDVAISISSYPFL